MVSFTLIFKKNSICTILFLMILGITGCTKDGDNLTFTTNTAIENISPESGPGDTEVTITGIAFETNENAISVFFNDVEAVINSITETEIKAIVPRGAQTGIVKVVTQGEETLGPEFTYIITPAQVSTLIRSEVSGDVDGPVAEASFSSLWNIAEDNEGAIYITDYGNNKIRKIDINNIVSTVTGMTGVTGSVDGTLAEATFSNPRSMIIDPDGNLVLVDFNNNNVRKIDLINQTVETIAGTGEFGLVNGIGSIAQFSSPIGLAIDSSGNLYVSDFSAATIRKITPDNVVSTFVGTGEAGFVDGPADVAQIGFVTGMEFDNDGNLIFGDGNRIRQVTPERVVSTIAGTGVDGDVDGESDVAQFDGLLDLDIDSEGNIIVVDFGNKKIRQLSPEGIVSTLAGTGEIGFMDGVPTIATFNNPRGLLVGENDIIYISTDDSIRIITPEF
ncbi:IPT/TIG domain-containing protein [Aquimarina amphilecti]|uniref:IPT/TIG domain-containing protein n=2 Tax=Aquimarina amphilecti TaxID=1038014 RepID=A0A1H7WQI5_AQUAM|nr:IPT/TIG domain-containing protein [Aquimarina amphilecti]